MKTTKPKAKSIKVLDWQKCTEFLEKKYGIQTRDYVNSHAQFDEWCDAKGYGDTDPSGNTRGQSQIWYAKYKADKVIKRPYQDFWHWLIDVANVERGGMLTLCVSMGADAEPWQQKILRMYLTEFGNGPFLTDW